MDNGVLDHAGEKRSSVTKEPILKLPDNSTFPLIVSQDASESILKLFMIQNQEILAGLVLLSSSLVYEKRVFY